MLFVHGTWLNAHTPRLARLLGRPEFQIDYRRLPGLLAEEIARRADIGQVDMVRSHYFGSVAENYDVRDHYAVQRRHAFFSELRAEGRFEVEAFSVDYQGRRLRRQDRSPEDDYIPAERCVDVALAVTVMRYVMTPAAVDLVILVAGDSDFVPLLREVRRIGKRVAVVSIEGACADELSRPGDRHGVRDFDVLWLDDLGEQIEKWRARGLRHETEPEPTESAASTTAVLRGRIKNVIRERGYGFIAGEDGLDYFFHANTLAAGLDFASLTTESPVLFHVRTGPSAGRAGAARLVSPAPDDEEEGEERVTAVNGEGDEGAPEGEVKAARATSDGGLDAGDRADLETTGVGGTPDEQDVRTRLGA
jgi:cold shock CspA family protein